MEPRYWENDMPNPYHSLLDPPRIYMLEENARSCITLPGVAAEVGVYHGGSLIRIAQILKKKTFYGIDTFNGMPETSDKDLHKAGDFSDVKFDFMVAFFKNVMPNVRLIKGRFPEEHVLRQIYSNEFCFVHVDVDLYISTFDCLEYFIPRLVMNGILIVDDYGFSTTPGAKKAVDEFVMNLNKIVWTKSEFIGKEYGCKALSTGQYWMKRMR